MHILHERGTTVGMCYKTVIKVIPFHFENCQLDHRVFSYSIPTLFFVTSAAFHLVEACILKRKK